MLYNEGLLHTIRLVMGRHAICDCTGKNDKSRVPCKGNTSFLRREESIPDITQNHGAIPYHIANIFNPLPGPPSPNKNSGYGLCRSTK